MILDTPKISKWLESVVPLLWFFVAGIGCGIAVYSYTDTFLLKHFGLLFLVSIALLIIHLFLPKNLYLLPFLTIRKFILLLASFSFGIFWYFKNVEVNSPTHILAEENGKYKFISTDISQVSILYGTIIADPDVREDSTNIVIKPHLIIPRPDKYTIEIDTTGKKVIVEKDKVSSVIDGDTFVTVTGQKVRLIGVNTPEINTLEGQKAKQFVEKKLLNKEVVLMIQEDYMFDIYDRILAIVFIDGVNLNKLLLEEGIAEYYEDPNITIIKKQPYGKPVELKGNTGLVRAKVLPTIGDYYFQMSYGDYVKIVSPILLPRKATNPAGFDYRRYLNARGIYAVTKTLRNPEDIQYKGIGKVNKFYQFAFLLRKRILLTIRKTVPYPQSAFLGGVTLGYRGGVPQKIREQFQATGVAHVLALSGLHTGFIAALLLILCNIFRIKSLLRFILVSVGLAIFVIMTGATPATQRAALMFCVGLFLHDVLKVSLVKTSKVTLAVAAAVILFFNPKMLPDASFVLSFMAVWSLIYVSPLIEKLLLHVNSKLVHQFITFPLFSIIIGMTFISLLGGILQEVTIIKQIFVLLSNFPVAGAIFKILANLSRIDIILPKWFNIETSKWLYKGEFFLLSLTFYFCGVIVHYLYSLSGKMLVKSMRSSMFSYRILQFVSAQVAIQLGMMWPLSSVYFYRFPIAGFYANFLAIPAIGLIVQLGWIAGVVDLFFSLISWLTGVKLIATLGTNLALLINATNNQLCQLFLGMAKTWGELVPYPYVEMFTLRSLVLWYGLLGILIWFDKIKQVFLQNKFRSVVIGVLFVSIVAYYFVYPKVKEKKEVKIVFFDTGFGNAVVIKTPSKNVLIDTGPPGPPGWSPAEAVISPTFTFYKIKTLDSVILTSLKPQCIGGTRYILSHFPTRKLYLPPNYIDCSSFTYYDFIEKTNLWYYLSNPYLYESTGLFIENYKLSKFLNSYKGEIRVVTAEKETVVEEYIDGEKFTIEILNAKGIKNTTDEIANNSLAVKISFAEKPILVLPQAGTELQDVLVSKFGEYLKSKVLLIPQNGHIKAYNTNFIKTVQPEIIICPYGWTNQRIGYFYPSYVTETQKIYESMNIKFLRTDYVGAVVITLGRKKFSYTTGVSEKEYKLRLATEEETLATAM